VFKSLDNQLFVFVGIVYTVHINTIFPDTHDAEVCRLPIVLEFRDIAQLERPMQMSCGARR